MKDFSIDGDVTRAADVDVTRGASVAESYRHFPGNTAAPVKSDRLKSTNKGDAAFQRKVLRSQRPRIAEVRSHRIGGGVEHLHTGLSMSTDGIGTRSLCIDRELPSGV